MIVIALDGSGSMNGDPWKFVVNAAKKFINHIKNHHINPNQV